jgi:hypothetical protein
MLRAENTAAGLVNPVALPAAWSKKSGIYNVGLALLPASAVLTNQPKSAVETGIPVSAVSAEAWGKNCPAPELLPGTFEFSTWNEASSPTKMVRGVPVMVVTTGAVDCATARLEKQLIANAAHATALPMTRFCLPLMFFPL